MTGKKQHRFLNNPVTVKLVGPGEISKSSNKKKNMSARKRYRYHIRSRSAHTTIFYELNFMKENADRFCLGTKTVTDLGVVDQPCRDQIAER